MTAAVTPSRPAVSPLLRAPLLAVWIGVLAGACSEWPRYAHLPEDGDLVPAGDPAALLDIDWTAAAEDGDAPFPAARAFDLPPGSGLVLDGILDGIGWSDAAGPREVPSCLGDDAVTPLPAVSDGDWIGDVDAVRLRIPTRGQLCVGAGTGAEDVGWDLVLYRLDGCGDPVDLARDDQAILGAGLGGPSGGWTAPIPAGEHDLAFAAYYPNDLDRAVPYTVHVAVLPIAEDGRLGPCPALPEAP